MATTANLTSGTYGYSESVYQIITTALLNLNVIADDEQPTPTMASAGLRALNGLVALWSAAGIRVWAQEDCLLFLQPNQTKYLLGPSSTDYACLWSDMTETTVPAGASAGASSLVLNSATGFAAGNFVGIQLTNGQNFWTTQVGAAVGSTVTLAAPLPAAAAGGAFVFTYATPLMRPLRVLEGRRYNWLSTQSTPLITLARFDYYYLPNLYNTGVVTQYFFDPQMGNGSYNPSLSSSVMNVWPTPQDNTNAMRFVGQRPLQKMTTMAQAPDFPSEWQLALEWGLAKQLGTGQSVPDDIWTRVIAMAEESFAIVSAWDREPEPVLFGVAWRPGYR